VALETASCAKTRILEPYLRKCSHKPNINLSYCKFPLIHRKGSRAGSNVCFSERRVPTKVGVLATISCVTSTVALKGNMGAAGLLLVLSPPSLFTKRLLQNMKKWMVISRKLLMHLSKMLTSVQGSQLHSHECFLPIIVQSNLC